MFEMVPFTRTGRGLSDYFDRMERSFFGGPNNLEERFSAICTDVVDKGDKYLLRAELPGFAKEDIQINLDGDRLVISAHNKQEKEEKEGENFVRRERSYGSFIRSFNLAGIRTEEISANYRNGLLELELPKAASQPPATKQIQIN